MRFLRRKVPDAIIEVDGGIAAATARRAKAAGADIVVSGSYIFGSADPAGGVRRTREFPPAAFGMVPRVRVERACAHTRIWNLSLKKN